MADHYIAPIPYTLADALLAEVFMMHYGRGGQATRRTISSGSCIYTIREIMSIKPGQIYLRQANDDQTYIRLLIEEERGRELLLVHLSQLNELFKRAPDEQATFPSIEEIKRSKTTADVWSKGAAYLDPPQASAPSARRLTNPEDKRAIEELRANPNATHDQRDEIKRRWTRAVGRNKSRTISAKSMGSTWRRLVARAKKPEE